MSPAEIQRMARVTLTEGAKAICFWTSAKTLPYYTEAFDALAPVYADIKEIEDILMQRRPVPASVGLLYSPPPRSSSSRGPRRLASAGSIFTPSRRSRMRCCARTSPSRW